MDKEEYFPRKRLFEEAQDLVASFYSTGDYISENASDYASMLIMDDDKDDFYYCLYLLSMLSNTNNVLKIVERIVKGLNPFRVRRRESSIEDFIGDIDIENYIEKNYIEKVSPKEYPSIVRYSTFQAPEYQLTLYIIRRIEEIYSTIFRVLGNNEKVTAFKVANKYCDRLKKCELKLRRKYGISYGGKDTYYSLKKKVVYRYRNRKLLDNSFKILTQLYEKMHKFKGIDLEAADALDLLDHYPSFDDRLYEIWLVRKSSDMLAEAMGISRDMVSYNPLFKARKNEEPVITLTDASYRVEVWFQNRKNLMPKEDLRWFFWDERGQQSEIGAIPDLVFIKYPSGAQGTENAEKIVLVDAKNRTWTLDHMEPIKNEVVQQIYIHDNFISLFEEEFSSMLIAHNINNLQTRKFYHKVNAGYEIDVISLNMISEAELETSMEKYFSDLKEYLDIV